MSYRIHDANIDYLEVKLMTLKEVHERFGGDDYTEVYEDPADTKALVIIDDGNQEVSVYHGSSVKLASKILMEFSEPFAEHRAGGVRDITTAREERIEKARLLRAQGKSFYEVAVEMKTPESTVRAWLKED